MDFSRRLKLFLFGIIIGSVAAWFIYGEKLMNKGWTPEERIKKRVEATLVKSTASAQQQLTAWPADLSQVKAGVPQSDVLVSETRRRGDSLFYTLEATVAQKRARLVVSVLEHYERDSTATLQSIEMR